MISPSSLYKIMEGVEYEDIKGNDTIISGIAYDSRTVREGDVYFALNGENFDGVEFIPDAIKRGCSAVVSREYDSSSEVASLTTPISSASTPHGRPLIEIRRR